MFNICKQEIQAKQNLDLVDKIRTDYYWDVIEIKDYILSVKDTFNLG